MTEQMTVRTGLKLDRRWVSCGDQAMCATMASVPPAYVVSKAAELTIEELEADRQWLADRLAEFSGPPGMELRTLDDDELESTADYYAVLLRIPLPNSQDPTTTFPVGRLGYCNAARHRHARMGGRQQPYTIGRLKVDVMRLMEALAMHEVREWMRFDGEHIVDPHPELN